MFERGQNIVENRRGGRSAMENAARISRSLNTLQEHTIMSRLLHLSHETMLHRSLNLIPIKKGEAVYLTGATD